MALANTAGNNRKAMSSFLHQRPLHSSLSDAYLQSSRNSTSQRQISIFNGAGLIALLCLLLVLGVLSPWSGLPGGIFSIATTKHSSFISKWRQYTLAEAASFVARNGTVIVCTLSEPYLPFLNNWLISISRQKHQDKVLVIAEDYATLYTINEKWPGHAVLVPPAPNSKTAHNFGSEGLFNITSRRPRHLLQILELGYSVMFNDVDMVWVGDPFPYLVGNHDVYFTDDRNAVKPLDHSHELPPPGAEGPIYICSGIIFMHPTDGAKLVMNKWIKELQDQPWSRAHETNDQLAFNLALTKTAGQVDLYLLPQVAFPSGGLYFWNKAWVEETKGKHVIIHNNYITGFEEKKKRFHDYGLWLVDDHADESPLGKYNSSMVRWNFKGMS